MENFRNPTLPCSKLISLLCATVNNEEKNLDLFVLVIYNKVSLSVLNHVAGVQ